ncbi:MAG: sensor domain-containing protein [Leptospirales bacterium]
MVDDIVPSRMIKILLIEDVPTDAELELRELLKAGIIFESRVVSDRDSFKKSLGEFQPDIILSDYSFPSGFNGLIALSISREMVPDTPFIFVSGTIGEERAIESLKMGATDYILKSRPDRLPQAVIRAIHDAEERVRLRMAEEALRMSEERFSLFMKHLPGVSYIKDVQGTYLYVNSYWLKTFHHSLNDVIGQKISDVWPQDISSVSIKNDREVLSTGKSIQVVEVSRSNGQTRYWLSTKFPIQGKDDTVEMIAGVSVDITERREQELRISRLTRIHEVLSGINAAIVRIRERDDLFREVCRIAVEYGEFPAAWIALDDAESARMVPVAWRTGEIQDEDSGQDLIFQGMAETLSTVHRSSRDFQVVIVNDIDIEFKGTHREPLLSRGWLSMGFFPIRVREGETGVLVFHSEEKGAFTDSEVKLLTELSNDLSFALESIEKEERLNYLAYFDVRTGLPNRTLFLDRLNQFIEAAKDSGESLAAVKIALERFQMLTDTMGRQTGDLLLKEFAARLAGIAGNPVSVAYVGEGCFALVLNDIGSESDVVHFLRDQLFQSLEEPFRVNQEEIRILVRVGVALFPGDGLDSDELMKNAGAALLKAQNTGESILFYTEQMNSRVAETIKLETNLHRALKNGEFVLHYQPKLDLMTGMLSGLEALIRWQNPDTGLVPPAQFIPVLEETGLILDVGRWVIDQAIRDGIEWNKRGFFVPRVAVNVSSIQLRQKDFVETVVKSLSAASPHFEQFRLEIEITESLIMENIPGTSLKLRQLEEMGVYVSIDDFGTGYSSLNYLAKLPVNELKIDQSFIVNMEESQESLLIVSAIISLAHSLKLSVVAEGVETQGQTRVLRGLSCNAIQGFLVSPPLAAREIERFLIPGATFL